LKVCVIGTGPAGLTTIKQLKDEGHEVTCFEKQANLGGIWYRNAGDADETKAYDNLILTISIRLMAFSDFMPDGGRVFYNRSQYMAYLMAYADRFGLRDHIVFNTAVVRVAATPDRRWRVTVRSGAEQQEHIFDAVAVCSGSFQKPNLDIADLDKFTGEVMHSSRYRNNERFTGKRVLVIGLAESGADLLREISDVTSECTLAIRTYSKLVPRIAKGNVATDATSYRAGHYEKWVRATEMAYPSGALVGETRAERLLFKTCATVYGLGTLAARGVSRLRRRLLGSEEVRAAEPGRLNVLGEPLEPEKMDLGTEYSQETVNAIEEWNRRSHASLGQSYTPKVIYCKNVSFIPNVLNGKLDVKHGQVVAIDGKTVQFDDGSKREYDAIVCATGFKKDFSILENVVIEHNNVRNLYKHAFHPDHGGTLALIGFVRPFTGGIPVCAEMQARYFAALCSGKVKLPADVRDRIAREKAWEEAHTILSPRHTEAIPSQPLFTDSIAKELGCLVKLSDLVFDPVLFVKHWFGSFNQSSYRLVGAHRLPDARARVMDEWIIGKELILKHCVYPWLPHHVHPRELVTAESVKRRMPGGDALAHHFLRPGADPTVVIAEAPATMPVTRPQEVEDNLGAVA
jgi:dimethylaniline monooxygenase (N-oxide forming)